MQESDKAQNSFLNVIPSSCMFYIDAKSVHALHPCKIMCLAFNATLAVMIISIVSRVAACYEIHGAVMITSRSYFYTKLPIKGKYYVRL